MLIIDSKTTVRDIDRWGTLIDPAEIYLEVRKIDQYNPVEVISIIQFLISNAGFNNQNSFILGIEVEELRSLPKDYDSYVHLLSLILFDRNGSFKLPNGRHLLTTDLFENFINKLRDQENLYTTEFEGPTRDEVSSRDMKRVLFPSRDLVRRRKGVSIFIPCFDHLRQQRLHRTEYFYTENNFKDEENVAIWMRRLFRYNKIKIELSNSIADLAVMVKELMQNTHDWARSTFDDSSFILPNLRACYLNLMLSYGSNADNLTTFDIVQQYLRNVLDSDQNTLRLEGMQGRIFDDSELGVCEVSVIDSGPGMACRILERDINDISFEDEAAAIIKCFHKYITSETGGRRQLRGKGLSKIIKLIKNKGLLRVRTGRVLLIRDFLLNPLSDSEVMNGNLTFKVDSGLMPVKGTTITVLYPFVYSMT